MVEYNFNKMYTQTNQFDMIKIIANLTKFWVIKF